MGSDWRAVTGTRFKPAAVLVLIPLIAVFSLCLCPGCGSDPDRNAVREEVLEGATVREEILNQQILQHKQGAIYDYEIIATFDHDPSYFTEGLVLEDGLVYEGTGRKGRSKLVKYDQETGDILREHDLDPSYFGEGITVLGDEVFQLTYTSNLGFVYDKDTFEQKRTFAYPTQGWGLTHNGSELIMSDGTSTLHFFDPLSVEEKGSVTVRDNEGPVSNLNELEYIDGEIYANVWKTSLIAIISPRSGEVTGWIDLAGMNTDPDGLKDDLVLNGIAYDDESGHLLVTGKCWPYMYEIELVPR
jgi:glutamine cyclotransferase